MKKLATVSALVVSLSAGGAHAHSSHAEGVNHIAEHLSLYFVPAFLCLFVGLYLCRKQLGANKKSKRD